jgi:hypothetical protein
LLSILSLGAFAFCFCQLLKKKNFFFFESAAGEERGEERREREGRRVLEGD